MFIINIILLRQNDEMTFIHRYQEYTRALIVIS